MKASAPHTYRQLDAINKAMDRAGFYSSPCFYYKSINSTHETIIEILGRLLATIEPELEKLRAEEAKYGIQSLYKTYINGIPRYIESIEEAIKYNSKENGRHTLSYILKKEREVLQPMKTLAEIYDALYHPENTNEKNIERITEDIKSMTRPKKRIKAVQPITLQELDIIPDRRQSNDSGTSSPKTNGYEPLKKYFSELNESILKGNIEDVKINLKKSERKLITGSIETLGNDDLKQFYSDMNNYYRSLINNSGEIIKANVLKKEEKDTKPEPKLRGLWNKFVETMTEDKNLNYTIPSQLITGEILENGINITDPRQLSGRLRDMMTSMRTIRKTAERYEFALEKAGLKLNSPKNQPDKADADDIPEHHEQPKISNDFAPDEFAQITRKKIHKNKNNINYLP